MKKYNDYIVYLIGLLFTIATFFAFYSRYQKGKINETLETPESYIGFGFGLMAIGYYLLKRKSINNSKDSSIKKNKIYASILMSIVFVCFGLLMISDQDFNYNRKISNEFIRYTIGYLCILFFGLILIISLRTLYLINFYKLELYFFDKNYFKFYNTLTARYIKIPIEEILNFESIEYLNNYFILIIVDDEGNYLNRVERLFSKFNKNNFGTYYCFSIDITNLNQEKALDKLNKKLKKIKIEHTRYNSIS